ncbi:MAG: YkgJ family cysteine cluster protein [Candidatus Bathyarchaeota archaeon]|nr:YkgJ family cysteine cluster protein [Candidatus Bathyarchaeota archaeon]
MHCSHCGICCSETEMLLSKKDIARLRKKGFTLDFFVRYDKEGYALLKNSEEGYCVFYDLDKRRCRIYFDRPSGCRVYPVILDEGEGIILDEICHCTGSIGAREKELQGKKVVKLLQVIDCEAEVRRLSNRK